MTNSVATMVVGPGGELLFGGERRGVCGDATREASTAQVQLFRGLIVRGRSKLKLIGVGGAATAEHVLAYLNAGAQSVHMATAAMVRPETALTIRVAMGGTP